ncbi:MAG: DUF4430 domain-containing protein [Tissierellia bacterium]|nr:DUF4430 domain-containing protein [Tissierellia bacterium]
MIFKNKRAALKITTLFMAMVMIAMVILPAAPAMAAEDNAAYDAKAEELIQNIYNKYMENGEVASSSNTELDGFAIYVLNKANVNVLEWEYEGETVDEKLENLIVDAVAKEADSTTQIGAKNLAFLYVAAESSNKATEATKLLGFLKTRQANSVNGGFMDGDYSEYTNLPVFDLLASENKLNVLEEADKAFEYIRDLDVTESEFPDFMSISQSARVLKGMEIQLSKGGLNERIKTRLEWQKANKAEDGSFNASEGNAVVNTSEVLWTINAVGLSTTLTRADKDGALDYLLEQDTFANIGANVWALRSLLVNGTVPNFNPTGSTGGEEKLNKITIRIEGPEFTILPETVVEVNGEKSYSDILIHNATALGYTVEEAEGFITSINGITDGGFWMVDPYEETYKDTDSFVFYGGGSSNTGDLTVTENSATVKDMDGNPVEGATVIYYTKDTMKTPTKVATLTDENGKVELAIEEIEKYHFAAHKINTGVYPEPDNGLVRTLPVMLSVKEVKVNMALIDNNGKVIYGPQSLTLKGNDKFGLTALGALEETGLDYLISTSNDFVESIQTIANEGLNGWMYAVNGETPPVAALEKTLVDGDVVLWYYSTSATTGIPAFPVKTSFTDVGANMAWAKEAIEALAAKGIIQGTGDNKFEPNRPITRAEFSKVVVETLGEDIVSEGTGMFSDVDSTKWYAEYIGKAAAKGLIEGNEGKFRPDDTITRNEVAVILHRMQNEVAPTNATLSFEDKATVPAWANDAVAYAVEKALVNGYPGNIFKGQDPMTRAEVAVVLYRYIQMMGL